MTTNYGKSYRVINNAVKKYKGISENYFKVVKEETTELRKEKFEDSNFQNMVDINAIPVLWHRIYLDNLLNKSIVVANDF